MAAPANQQLAITVVDLHSKWIEVALSAKATTVDVCKVLDSLFDRFGLREQVTTDNGPQFVSYDFSDYLQS